MKDSPEEPGETFLIGVGIVGREVAAAHLTSRLPIHCIDLSLDRLDDAYRDLARRIPGLESTPATPWGDAWSRQIVPADARPVDAGQSVPVVIESVAEKREIKRDVLAGAARRLGPRALLGTNTSTLPLRDLHDARYDGSRLVGLHFFMPVMERRLVEVVSSRATHSSATETACLHVARLERQPLCVQDGPGFVVNRMLAPYLNQSVHALCRGASPEQLESVARAAGLPFGPLELLDWIGLETAFHAGRAIWQAFPKRIDPSPLLPAMLKARLLGRQSGCGFYAYESGNRSAELSEAARSKISVYSHEERTWTLEDLREWLFLPMLLEAVCLILDGVTDSADAIGIAMEGGLGWSQNGGFFGLWNRELPGEILARIHAWSANSRIFSAPMAFEMQCPKASSMAAVLDALVDARP